MSDGKISGGLNAMPNMKIVRKDLQRYEIAKAIAAESACRFKIGAVIYLKSRLVAAACNVLRSHPGHKRYPEWTTCIHAEHRAILKAKVDLTGATCYIARANSVNECAKPCYACRIYLIESGIRTVVYSDNTTIVKESISDHV